MTTVRRADVSDASALALLRWEWEYGEGSPEGQGPFTAHFTLWMEAHAGSHLPYLAETEAGQAIGMAWLVLQPRVPSPGNGHRTNGDLQSVYVTPSRRGEGIGQRLVQAVVDDAARRELPHLTVRTGSTATSFYPPFGFAPSQRALELTPWP